MKFCELSEIFEDYAEIYHDVLNKPGFEQLREAEQCVETHIAAGNRDVLDMTVPDNLVEEALAHHPAKWIELQDKLVREQEEVKAKAIVHVLTSLEVYRRWGSTAMLVARDRRWWDIPPDRQKH